MDEDRDRFLLDRRYGAFLSSLDDTSLGSLAAALDEDLRDTFSRIVGLPEGIFGDVDTSADPAAVGAAVRDGYVRRQIGRAHV